MKTDIKTSASHLRQKAEELLKKKPINASAERPINPSDAETLKLLHELEVRQIELELQNEELRLAINQAEALTEIENNYRLLFFNNPQPMIIFDLETLAFLEVNEAAVKSYGYSKEEFLKLNLKDIHLDEDNPALLNDIKLTRRTINTAGQWRHIRKNGELMFVEITSHSMVFNGRNARHVLINDITARKQSEADLLQSVQQWKAMISASPDGIGMASMDGKLQFMSDKLAMMYGYSVEEKDQYIGTSFLDFIDPSYHQKLIDKIQKLVTEDGNHQVTEYLAVKKDKSKFFVEINSNVLHDSKGNPSGFLYVERDVADRKQAEQNICDLNANLELLVAERTAQLTETNNNLIKEIETRTLAEEELATEKQHLSDIIKGANLGTWKWNVQTGETTFNERWAEIIGYSLAEISPVSIETWKKFAHPDDLKISGEAMEKHFKGECDFYAVESRMKHKDGSWVWVFDRGNVQYWDKDGKPLLMSGTRQNITQHKRAEDELKLLSTRLTLALHAGGLGVWDYDIVNNILLWDDQMFALYGVEKQNFGGAYDAWQTGLHPDDRERGDAEIQMAISGEKEFNTEFRVVWANGVIRNIRAMAIVYRDSSGNPLRMIGTNWDITAQKQADYLIEQPRRNYETFFNAIDDFLFVLDEQGNMIYTNNTVIKRLGYSTDELMGNSVLMVHPPERRKEAGRIVGEMLAGTAEFCPVPLLVNNGDYIPVETRVSQGFWDGKPAIFGVSKDMSKIQLSEEKFSKAFHSNAALMAISGFESGRFLDVNETFIKILGYSREELIGKTSFELHLFDASELRNAIIENIKQHIPIREVELVAKAKSGDVIYGLFSADLIHVGKDLCLLTMMVDITALKRNEEDLKKARSDADKANVAKSEFLSRMSHELRTPMNSILGFAQLMEMSELSPAHRKGVNFILNSGNHLLNLINEVLDISRIEAGRISISLEPVQLNGIIIQMLDVVYPEAAKRHLKTELVTSPDNMLFVRADRQRLQQILINLINNAVKYNREGGSVIIKTKLQQTDASGISSVRISISDTGIGIKPENINKLFQPFERIDGDKTETEGTGLGLMVVKKLMTAMGGAVGVESVPGEGSTFWIELPLIEIQTTSKEQNDEREKLLSELINANMEIAFQNEEKAKRAEELIIANKELAFQNEEKAKRAEELICLNKELAFQKEGSLKTGQIVTRQTGTILYIEDNISNAELVEEIIASYRPAIRLIISRNGKHAVTYASDYEPDLILLDLDLPDISGHEALKLLHAEEKTKNIPVVIISADAMPHQIDRLKKAGAVDYLTKPLDVIIFLSVVDRFIRTRDEG
ncbi:MAG: PAS domain S-box protein [Bacteroidetes bacterium]|nr:PAS domain S-box protein [Bacteroidota bacterium]